MINVQVPCLSGLVLSCPLLDPYPIVDFVLSNSTGKNMVLWAGWWDVDYEKNFGLTVIQGPLIETEHGLKFNVAYDCLLMLTGFDTSWQKNQFESLRTVADIRRSVYFQRLDQLSGNLNDPEFAAQISEWKGRIGSRPIEDVGELFIRRNSVVRLVGSIALLNSESQKVDSLVIDEFGNAATKSGNTWLESLGSQWQSFSDSERPEVEEFLLWVSSQNPHDGSTLGVPNTFRQEGLIQALAIQ